MYWFDYVMHVASVETSREEEDMGRKHTIQEGIDNARLAGLRVAPAVETEPYSAHGVRLCERADDQGLLHACNSTWLEVRTWNNDIRGVMTLFGSIFYWMLLWFGGGNLANLIHTYATGRRLQGDVLTTSELFAFSLSTLFITTISIVSVWATYRFFLRYEIFNQRWIRVRFNRQTGKVYLLRPTFAGGLAIFDWKDTDPMLDASGEPSKPMLHWGAFSWMSPKIGGPSAIHFIGRRVSFETQADWMAFWEYIRRYMEEGPQSVPTPKTVIGYGPSLKEAWISITQWYPSLQQKGAMGRISDGITLLILPLIFIMVLGNFLGQCLTWNARFPKEIEEAGKA